MRPQLPDWLEELCQKLADNDPAITTIEFIGHRRLDDTMTRALCSALEENDTVNTIAFSCHAIIDDGAYALGKVLAISCNITHISLRDARSSRELLTLFENIRKNIHVQELSLRHCQLCSRSTTALASLLRTLPCLHVSTLQSTYSFVAQAFTHKFQPIT